MTSSRARDRLYSRTGPYASGPPPPPHLDRHRGGLPPSSWSAYESTTSRYGNAPPPPSPANNDAYQDEQGNRSIILFSYSLFIILFSFFLAFCLVVSLSSSSSFSTIIIRLSFFFSPLSFFLLITRFFRTSEEWGEGRRIRARLNALSTECIYRPSPRSFKHAALAGNSFWRAGTIRNEGGTITRYRWRACTLVNGSNVGEFLLVHERNWKWHEW